MVALSSGTAASKPGAFSWPSLTLWEKKLPKLLVHCVFLGLMMLLRLMSGQGGAPPDGGSTVTWGGVPSHGGSTAAWGRSTAGWKKKDCCQQVANMAERIVNDSFLSF